MRAQVLGTMLPVLEFTLERGETIVSDSGRVSWMRGVRMRTKAAGGLLGALRRVAGRGTFFLSEFTAQEPSGLVAFAARVPGEIISVDLRQGDYLVHEHGFLCGSEGVRISVGVQRTLGAGVFGGTGYVLQRLSGDADAWVELSGEVVRYDLDPDESLLVQPGHVGMFQDSVDFEITTVPGVRNLLFGGDGFFLVRLTGPGSVFLQSMPIAMLAHSIAPYLPEEES